LKPKIEVEKQLSNHWSWKQDKHWSSRTWLTKSKLIQRQSWKVEQCG